MKKNITKLLALTLLVLPLVATVPAQAATQWDTTGSYVANMNYLGTDYAHDIILVQDNAGNLTGNGGSPAGANIYTWTITSGSVNGNVLDFFANYTATADAVTPLTTMHVLGTIAPDGTMSGVWSDNYQASTRTGTWDTTSGTATTTPPVTPVLTNKNQCKNNGWKTFTNPSFKNQGQCVSYLQSNENAGKRN